MKTLSLRLPDDLVSQLGAIAKKKKTNRSNIMRQALKTYLNGTNKVQKGSVQEVARHLIGSLQGPEDLSSNKAYLRDYGK